MVNGYFQLDIRKEGTFVILFPAVFPVVLTDN